MMPSTNFKRHPFRLLQYSIALLLILPLLVQASDISIQPFEARYRLYKGSVYVANVNLNLQQAGQSWHWRMSTKAKGIFSLFTRKNPVSETSLLLADSKAFLQQINIDDAGDKKRRESAFFDWESKKVEIERREQLTVYDLNGEVFDYHSIHVLAALMTSKKEKSRTVDFYHKGKLVKSTVDNIGKIELKLGDQTVQAQAFEQILVGSSSKTKYFYDADNPALPLRIEQHEPDDSTAIMVLDQVK